MTKEFYKIPAYFHVEADNIHEAEELIMQLASDYYKHYPKSQVERIEIE